MATGCHKHVSRFHTVGSVADRQISYMQTEVWHYDYACKSLIIYDEINIKIYTNFCDPKIL